MRKINLYLIILGCLSVHGIHAEPTPTSTATPAASTTPVNKTNSTASASTVTPDPKYCVMYKQLHTGMAIGDVFLLMGPPHTFGQPPNLNTKALNKQTPVTPPQTALSNDPQAVRQRVLASMSNDPILGSFINAPADYSNVLIWSFENNSLSVSIKVKGPIVTDVKANFSCT
jgi:hypothetical protein